MARLTLEEAGEAVGLSRQTIWRATKDGRLSSEKDSGVTTVDVSELTRLFEPTKAFMAKLTGSAPDVADDVAADGGDATAETTGNNGRNERLQIELKLLRERFDMMGQMHEEQRKGMSARIEELLQDRSDLRAERDKLLTTLHEQALSVRQLTHQPAATTPAVEDRPAPVAAAVGGRRGLFGLFGR